MNRIRTVSVSCLTLALVASALAAGPVAPALSSRPGATYTLYLDFSGFDYSAVANSRGTGTWGQTGKSPSVVPAYTTDSDATSFSASENQAIKDTWARYVNAYTGFNVNITTVDPAASGLTDAQRQASYDRSPYVMHTIIGGTYNWFGSSGGVSYVGTTQTANTFSGGHANWVFPVNGSGTSAKGMAAAGIHEDGHGLNLPHQHDEATGSEYSDNNGASGNGSYAPIMGTTYTSQRGTWRIGSTGAGNVNDVSVLEANGGMGDLLDDGIGHSLDTATALALGDAGSINVGNSLTKGFIMPLKSTGYSADSYTKDYFSFNSAGGLVTLVAHDGNDKLTAGVADPGATMRSVVKIFSTNGTLIGMGAEDSTTLLHTFSATLPVGSYYAEISSYGAYTSSYEANAKYFNMGGYFLTGSGFAQAVPEPASLVAIAAGFSTFHPRRRKSA